MGWVVRTLRAESRWLRAIFLSSSVAPKLAVAAGFAYLVGPWDIIPSSTPIFGHFDEVGLVVAGLIAAHLLVLGDFESNAADWQWAPGRNGLGGTRAAFSRFMLDRRADALTGWLVSERRVQRLRGSLPQAVRRVGRQVSQAAAGRDPSSVLFGLVGYRLWWTGRSFLARSRSDLRSLVVIGGSPRAGTTLLRSILGRHPHIYAGPETTVFLHRISAPAEIAERLGLRAADVAEWQRQSRCQMDFIERCATAVLRRSGKTVWAEKTPHNVGRFGFVRRRFPHAKLVHIVRDGRDVVCSLREKPFSKVEHAASDSVVAARHCAMQWRTSVMAGLRFRRDPAYHELRYEDLVHDPEPVLRALLIFLDVPWDDAILRSDRNAGPPDPYEPRAAGPIFESSVGRWRTDLPDRDRAAVRALTEPLLCQLGYSADPSATTPGG